VLGAGSADYAQILELNANAVPHVNLIDESTLGDLHRQSLALLVARHDSQPEDVAGFLLALPETASYASLNFRYFQDNVARFAYVDRIITSPQFRRLGVGAALYRALFGLAGSRPVTCEVNVKPPNPGSMAFHEALGFQKLDEQDTEGGAKRVALLLRDVAP
jgi:predicted GNAT superfamily acetyltransferase